MSILFETHKEADLYPGEKRYAYGRWTGARFVSEYFYLVQGTNKKRELQRFIFSDPRAAVDKIKELRHDPLPCITRVQWPDGQQAWTMQRIRYILGNPSQSCLKIKTIDGMYTYKDPGFKGSEQAGPFWLLYSDGEDADPSDA